MATITAQVKKLHDVGTHVGLARTRRHPTAVPFIFSTKNRIDILNLEETERRLELALAFLRDLASVGKSLLVVGGKHEAIKIIDDAAEAAGLPHVAGRWIGGTLTNFKNIRKRVERLEKLQKDRASGELAKYTKRERLMIDREIEELEGRFGGIVSLRDLPGALFVVDSRHEAIAVKEANQMGVPVIALSSTDCDFSQVQFPIPGNDTSVKSVRAVVEMVVDAYQEGKKAAPKAVK
jgi:small subunit ribosomal protein S2